MEVDTTYFLGLTGTPFRTETKNMFAYVALLRLQPWADENNFKNVGTASTCRIDMRRFFILLF